MRVVNPRSIIDGILVPALERAEFHPVSGAAPASPATADDSWSLTNGRVRLGIYHAQQTGELSVTLEHPDKGYPGVPLHQLFLRESDIDVAWTAHGLILYQEDRSKAAIERLASAIDRNAVVLARLTTAEVTQLYDDWLEAGRAHFKHEETIRTVAAAEALWHEGNFQDCAKLLAEIEPQLSPAQQKRLQLARQRAQPG